jgi:hypothetical protein
MNDTELSEIEAERWLDKCVLDIHNKLGLDYEYILHHLAMVVDRVVLRMILEKEEE